MKISAHAPVVLVDDSAWVFDLYLEPLREVLNRPVHPLLHGGQEISELVRALRELAPGAVLLDGHLEGGIEGPEVLQELLRQAPGLAVVGFSSDSAYAEPFLRAGAIGFIHKRRLDPRAAAREVAVLLAGGLP